MAAEKRASDHLNDMSIPLSEKIIFKRGFPNHLKRKTTSAFCCQSVSAWKTGHSLSTMKSDKIYIIDILHYKGHAAGGAVG